MSVLNDKQIIELSTLPTFMLSTGGNVALTHTTLYGSYVDFLESEKPSYKTEEEILTDVNNPFPNLHYLSHRELTEEEKQATRLMISPFSPVQVRTEKVKRQQITTDRPYILCPDGEEKERKIISWGTSSFGYDFRVDRKFKIFTNINSCVVDPLDFDPASFVDHEGDYCLVPPNSFVLCNTMEYFKMPKDVVGIVTGKSTIARSGLSIMATPLEPGWEGYLTLEYANTTPLPVKLYAGMGGGQIVFFRGEQPLTTYDQRQGKYQGQAAEPVTPRV